MRPPPECHTLPQTILRLQHRRATLTHITHPATAVSHVTISPHERCIRANCHGRLKTYVHKRFRWLRYLAITRVIVPSSKIGRRHSFHLLRAVKPWAGQGALEGDSPGRPRMQQPGKQVLAAAREQLL